LKEILDILSPRRQRA